MSAYRVPFMNELGDRLAAMDGALLVAESSAPPSIAQRQDERHGDYGRPVDTKWVSLGGREIGVRRVEQAIREFSPDYVVLQQELRNLESYPLIAGARLRKFEVGFWGHGRSYSTSQTELEASAKQWLTRRTKWFFAYTQAGADHVVKNGFPRVRTTVLNNTIDTASLRSELESVGDQEVADFRTRLGLSAGKTALFIGGVDDAKGISFLLDPAPRIAEMLPGFTLLVAGDGARRADVQHAESGGAPIRYLGRLDGRARALALKVADVMAIPEWIGLVAIDSLVAGRPIVTTHHHSHSPEHEYLEAGVTCVYSIHDPADYAADVVKLLNDNVGLEAMQSACLVRSEDFSIELMADAFLRGILDWDEMRRFGL